jgi:hypothetical protein
MIAQTKTNHERVALYWFQVSAEPIPTLGVSNSAGFPKNEKTHIVTTLGRRIGTSRLHGLVGRRERDIIPTAYVGKRIESWS